MSTTIVYYTFLAGDDTGTKGSYAADTADIERAILITKMQLIGDFIDMGTFANADPADLFVITKAEVIA